jgi:thaumarchaeosortase
MQARTELMKYESVPVCFLVAPIVYLVVIDSASFAVFWFWGDQIGRAGFAFILFIVAWEWFDSRQRLTARRGTRRLFVASAVTVALFAYYWERVTNDAWTRSMRVLITSQFGVSQEAPLSFLLAMDYLLYAIFSLCIVAVFYGPRSIRLMITPAIYAVGSGVLDLMDAFYPEDSLAFMQTWVYLIWNVVLGILVILGFRIASPGSVTPPSILLRGNQLSLWGYKGFIRILIFWPSSGVVSMIMYSLVLIILLIKLDAPRRRKATYAAIGALGTYFANVFRIILIILYVAYISLDVKTFHDSIGEIIFLTWILGFLYFVVSRENRLSRKSAKSPISGRLQVPVSFINLSRINSQNEGSAP